MRVTVPERLTQDRGNELPQVGIFDYTEQPAIPPTMPSQYALLEELLDRLQNKHHFLRSNFQGYLQPKDGTVRAKPSEVWLALYSRYGYPFVCEL